MNEIFSNLNKDTLLLALVMISFLGFVFISIIKLILKRAVKLIKNDKKSFIVYSYIRLILNLLYFGLLMYVWSDYVENFITLISFLSAGFAFGIRDIILNWFCGIYIKIKKPLKLEDRIEVSGIKGDVIGLSTLGFEVLEVSDKEENGQSTGIVINFPNSVIFTSPVKNITKGFKYIWNEMHINIKITADLKKSKQVLYKIINSIDIVKIIPKKMKNQIDEVNTTYRIYYNNYEPVIYTKIEEDHVVLSLRYLIHPKKARYVESLIWNKIHEAYKNGELELYLKEKHRD